MTDLQTYYCNEQVDLYAVITTLYYLIFGIMGLTLNNSYTSNIFSYFILTAIGLCINYIGIHTSFGINALIFTSCDILYKLIFEIIKKKYDDKYDLNELSKKYYRVPSGLLSLGLNAYICASLIWYNIYFTLPVLLLIGAFTTYAIFSFFPQGSEFYTTTRHMLIRIITSLVIGSGGLITSLYCPDDIYMWVRIFIGWPIANICLSYSLFLTVQIIVLIRGKNLKRKVSIRNTNFIYVTYYIGRSGQLEDTQ